jgi:protein tyrosine/serine phosphatase
VQRDLVWDGCLNVRDLGGQPTRDGGETRFGRVVRSDSVDLLSDDGWRALVDYGVRTVVDLRGDHEREERPPRDLPVEVVHVPFMEASAEDWKEIEQEILAAEAAAPDGPTTTRDVYLIFLERFHARAAAGIRAVADAPEGVVVVHCVGGKDRTGLLTAFLLELAGVPRDRIGADYALSEERLRVRHEAWLEAAETEAERERLRRIARSPAEAMVAVLEELDRRWGGVRGFLLAGGLDEETIDRAAARLRE